MNPFGTLTNSLIVAAGGAVGAVLRYQSGRLLTYAVGPARVAAFPWATLGVNIVGSFLMGVLAGWLVRYGPAGEHWRLLLGVGVLGGFTTFSAFSFEMAMLIQRGQPGSAALYAALSVSGGIFGLFAGLSLARTFA